jgi:hypothetical protein
MKRKVIWKVMKIMIGSLQILRAVKMPDQAPPQAKKEAAPGFVTGAACFVYMRVYGAVSAVGSAPTWNGLP